MPHLVSAIINTGKPTIVVFSSGKPITEAWISTNASALVQQFYPSEEGGNALADILYGDVNPSGKLSVGKWFSLRKFTISSLFWSPQTVFARLRTLTLRS